MATETATGAYNLGINKTSKAMTSWFTQSGEDTRMILANEGASDQLLNLYVGANHKVNLAVRNTAGVAAVTLSYAGEQPSCKNIISDKVIGRSQGAYDAIQAGLSIVSAGIMAIETTNPVYSGKSSKPSGNAREMHKVPYENSSISQIEKSYKNKPGEFHRRFFDFKGNASLDVDFTPHSHPDMHSNPHLHIWYNGRQYQINI